MPARSRSTTSPAPSQASRVVALAAARRMLRVERLGAALRKSAATWPAATLPAMMPPVAMPPLRSSPACLCRLGSSSMRLQSRRPPLPSSSQAPPRLSYATSQGSRLLASWSFRSMSSSCLLPRRHHLRPSRRHHLHLRRLHPSLRRHQLSQMTCRGCRRRHRHTLPRCRRHRIRLQVHRHRHRVRCQASHPTQAASRVRTARRQPPPSRAPPSASTALRASSA